MLETGWIEAALLWVNASPQVVTPGLGGQHQYYTDFTPISQLALYDQTYTRSTLSRT
jgi:hypothetical protein